MLERSSYIVVMNTLGKEKRIAVIAALVEGNSIRSTCRMTGVAKGTVLKLLVDLGQACAEYRKKTLVNLHSKRVQCDEIWSFCYAKEKNAPEDLKALGRAGDVWTWTALDSESKLTISWLVGDRDGATAKLFIADLASRLASKIQLTTDGHKVYLEAVETAFGLDVDYAMLVKVYGQDPEPEKRYSPAQCLGSEKTLINGNPDLAHVSTSHVERQNLTMRMSMRRFTRLNQRLLEEGSEPRGSGCPSLHVVQLRPSPPDPSRDARDGIRDCGSHLAHRRSCRVARRKSKLTHYRRPHQVADVSPR